YSSDTKRISVFSTLYFFFFNHPATTDIYTLSLHDALPILHFKVEGPLVAQLQEAFADDWAFCTKEGLAGDAWFPKLQECGTPNQDRKSTRLNSSHVAISYAVFCLKKKKKTEYTNHLATS